MQSYMLCYLGGPGEILICQGSFPTQVLQFLPPSFPSFHFSFTLSFPLHIFIECLVCVIHCAPHLESLCAAGYKKPTRSGTCAPQLQSPCALETARHN